MSFSRTTHLLCVSVGVNVIVKRKKKKRIAKFKPALLPGLPEGHEDQKGKVLPEGLEEVGWVVGMVGWKMERPPPHTHTRITNHINNPTSILSEMI